MSEPLKPLENYMIRPVRDQAPEPEEKEWEGDDFCEYYPCNPIDPQFPDYCPGVCAHGKIKAPAVLGFRCPKIEGEKDWLGFMARVTREHAEFLK